MTLSQRKPCSKKMRHLVEMFLNYNTRSLELVQNSDKRPPNAIITNWKGLPMYDLILFTMLHYVRFQVKLNCVNAIDTNVDGMSGE